MPADRNQAARICRVARFDIAALKIEQRNRTRQRAIQKIEFGAQFVVTGFLGRDIGISLGDRKAFAGRLKRSAVRYVIRSPIMMPTLSEAGRGSRRNCRHRSCARIIQIDGIDVRSTAEKLIFRLASYSRIIEELMLNPKCIGLARQLELSEITFFVTADFAARALYRIAGYHARQRIVAIKLVVIIRNALRSTHPASDLCSKVAVDAVT